MTKQHDHSRQFGGSGWHSGWLLEIIFFHQKKTWMGALFPRKWA
jgi:hypothetical protein